MGKDETLLSIVSIIGPTTAVDVFFFFFQPYCAIAGFLRSGVLNEKIFKIDLLLALTIA